MTKLFTLVLLAFTLFITSCEKDDPIENDSVDVSNLSGEFFENLTKNENIEYVVIIEIHEGAADYWRGYDSYSFPGNNFISVWNDYGSTIKYSEKGFNLDEMIWYKIDDYEIKGVEARALHLAY